MKRLLLTLCIATLFLTGCKSSAPSQPETDKQTNAFPYEIPYQDESFELTSINTFCEKSESGHGYYTYILLRFNTACMSEDGRYWMLKDQDELKFDKIFDTSVFMKCNDNEIDFDTMTQIAKSIKDDYIYLAFKSRKEVRHEYTPDNTEFIITTNVYQSDSASGEKREIKWNVNSSYGEIFLPMLSWDDFTSEMEQSIKDGKGMELNNQ